MFFYNIKVAFRSLVRQKSNSIINILGLTLGITCTFLLFLMVYFSYTTDLDQKNYERLFLLQQDISLASGDFTADKTGGATAPTMAEAYPQIQSYTRLGILGEMLLSYYPEGKNESSLPVSFVEKGGAAVDSTFFEVFSFEFIAGQPSTMVTQSKFIYLTETIAQKLFKEANPIGKTVYFQEGLELTVHGVLKDIPNNSTIQFSYLVPFEVESMIGVPIDGFAGNMFYSYFVLDDPNSANIINRDINEFLESKYEESLEINRHLSHIREVFLIWRK